MTADLATILTTLGLYAAVVVSPGPNFALVSKLAISGSRQGALGATLGLAVAATFYAILTMTGLSLVLTRIGWFVVIVQIVGGCYLLFLGVSAWLRPKPLVTGTDLRTASVGAMRGFRTGLIVNLSNPKGITFFLSFYATAIPLGTSLAARLVILAGGFALEVLWYSLVVALLSSPAAKFAYQKVGAWVDRLVGTVLMAFGARLILERL